MRKPRNNRELQDYLVQLGNDLAARGLVDLGGKVCKVAQVPYTVGTEFLGESRIVLRRVAADADTVLSAEERAAVADVLAELDRVLDRRA